MTHPLVRGLSMLAAGAALLAVALWLVAGAPNLSPGMIDPKPNRCVSETHTYAALRACEAKLTPEERKPDLSNLTDGMLTLSTGLLYRLRLDSPWSAETGLAIIALTVTVAALLGLFLLLRGGRVESIAYLGVGLGLWSGAIAYLWFVSVLPDFQAELPRLMPGPVLADVLAFEMLLVAGYAFLQFWARFPRPVSDTELDGFMRAVSLGRSAWFAPVCRLLRRFQTGSGRSRPWLRWSVASGLALVAGLGWRVFHLFPFESVLGGEGRSPALARALAVTYLWSVSALGFVALLYWPWPRCTRLFRFHRAVGSAEDRRRVEWFSAALWIAFVLFMVPASLLAAQMLLDSVLPGEVGGHGGLVDLLWLGVLAGPLVVLVALAVAVLYRGTVDPQLALRGVTVWTLLGVVLTLIFVFAERTAAVGLVKLFGLPPQTGFVTAGALVAATFQPVRKFSERRVTRFVERVLPASVLATGRRHTQAVAVVDLSGYTALSARDEAGALLASTLLQKEARRLADLHRGRVVKTTGDGVIVSFAAAADALAAVTALHRSVARAGAAMELPVLQLHSGLHWGEVTEMHDGDLYGMTVNLAARLADWARAGEIGASEVFVEALPSGEAPFEPRGLQVFKNVPTPLSCLVLTVA